MNFSIITSCASRKRDTGIEPLVPVLSPDLSMNEMLKSWTEQVNRSQVRVAPLDLYQGRTFSECRAASRIVGADLYVVSAGLGLVHPLDAIPNYSATISEGIGSLRKWLSSLNLGPSDWWNSLCHAMGKPSPISALVNAKAENCQHLMALPSSYLEMVVPDLTLIQDSQLKNLRIFTSLAGAKVLPKGLQTVVMPYDESLEGIANYKGTRSDFPQRALKHYVAHIKGHELSHESAIEAVKSAMSKAVKPTVPVREKVSDDAIVELIRANWQRHGGSANKLLRFLRDDAMVACEQSRFSGIWQRVKVDKSSEGQLYV